MRMRHFQGQVKMRLIKIKVVANCEHVDEGASSLHNVAPTARGALEVSRRDKPPESCASSLSYPFPLVTMETMCFNLEHDF